jgi:hypothetical protein
LDTIRSETATDALPGKALTRLVERRTDAVRGGRPADGVGVLVVVEDSGRELRRVDGAVESSVEATDPPCQGDS